MDYFVLQFRRKDDTMKITVLDRKSMGNDLDFSVLAEWRPDVSLTVYDETKREDLFERAINADVLVLNKIKMTEDVLRFAENLKLICVFATGYDNIDLAAAKEMGIAVCNVPAYSTESVLLLTVSTALSLAARIPTFSDYVKTGDYTRSGVPNYLTPVFHECRGLTWGIVGCGNIGSRVAEVAASLGMKVIVYQRHPSAFRNVDLDTLCRESDIISLHCPLTDSTRSLIGERELSLMKKTCVLVNEARGAVLDEAAVGKAVINGSIGAFGSDVYGEEPFPKTHPYNAIMGLPNVILTPHVAWAAYEARVRCLRIIRDNIISWSNGEIKNRVDI